MEDLRQYNPEYFYTWEQEGMNAGLNQYKEGYELKWFDDPYGGPLKPYWVKK